MKGTIIDVRSRAEYMGGHVTGSINMPLQDIPKSIEKIKSFSQPIILCCASGNRSGQAVEFLQRQGIDCENGGSWMEVNFLINNK